MNKSGGKFNERFFYDSGINDVHRDAQSIMIEFEHRKEEVTSCFQRLLDVKISNTPRMEISIRRSFFNGMKGFKYEEGQVRLRIPAFMTEMEGKVERKRKNISAQFHPNSSLNANQKSSLPKRPNIHRHRLLRYRGQEGDVLKDKYKIVALQL